MATASFGEVAERLNVLAWKASRGDEPLEGSNPSLSEFNKRFFEPERGSSAQRAQRAKRFLKLGAPRGNAAWGPALEGSNPSLSELSEAVI